MNSRRKGHNWERDIAARLRSIFGPDRVRRGRQAEGATEPDVVVDGAPWWIECKCGGPATKPATALAQAEEDSDKAPGILPRWPVAVCKADRRPAVAAMRLSTLLTLAGKGVQLGRILVSMPLDDWLRIAEAAELHGSAARGAKHSEEWG